MQLIRAKLLYFLATVLYKRTKMIEGTSKARTYFFAYTVLY
jgi:hypothetical protein